MSSFETLNEMDPAARAVAEVRARQAGMSIGKWLDSLVYGQASQQHGASLRHLGGGVVSYQPEFAAGSSLMVTGVNSNLDYHLGFPTAAAIHLPEEEARRIEAAQIAVGVSAADQARAIQISEASALHFVAAFPPRISHAALLLSAAFAESEEGFSRPTIKSRTSRKAAHTWYEAIVASCLHHSREVRSALLHRWSPHGRAERLWDTAFLTLCDLTPARRELVALLHSDRGKASAELARYVELATRQFELSAKLLGEVDDDTPPQSASELRFRQLRSDLLARAGGGLSLTEGSALLGITRQALHKRIKSGTAMAMMDADELVLPKCQWLIDSGNKVAALPGLTNIVRIFGRAGGWSALQFLLDPDPNLGKPPIEALHEGAVPAVVAAARSYLGLNEG